MSDPVSCDPPRDLEPALVSFQRHAFATLLTGDAPRVTDVAETASREAVDVLQAIAWLEAHGLLERDGDVLVGAHGLTHHATPHALTIGGRTLHTWCAYDAVAIPAALAVTAQARTTCPTCGRELVVDVDAGRLPEDAAPVLWMPTCSCEHVRDDFCAQANLFCTREHLDTWRRTAGDPPGHPVTLAAVPALAWQTWADVARQP
jgi:alkylmercury lyase